MSAITKNAAMIMVTALALIPVLRPRATACATMDVTTQTVCLTGATVVHAQVVVTAKTWETGIVTQAVTMKTATGTIWTADALLIAMCLGIVPLAVLTPAAIMTNQQMASNAKTQVYSISLYFIIS